MSPLLVLALLQTADGRLAHPKVKTLPPVGSGPVTAREARESFLRASALLTKVHGVGLGLGSIPAADRPATRAEIVAEMTRLAKASEPTFRFTPALAKYTPARFKIDTAQRAALGRLVGRGLVAPVGPLATGPGPGLTPKELGDALGFFVSRLAQMSHLPSPKWTPMLQKE